MCLGNTLFEREGEWNDVPLVQFKYLLKEAALNIRSMSERNFVAQGRGPNNPGLYRLIETLDMFWRTHSPNKANIAALFRDDYDADDQSDDPHVIQVPLNESSRFCCEIAQLIDPTVTTNQVRTVMKSIEIPGHLRKFIIKGSRIGGRDTC